MSLYRNCLFSQVNDDKLKGLKRKINNKRKEKPIHYYHFFIVDHHDANDADDDHRYDYCYLFCSLVFSNKRSVYTMFWIGLWIHYHHHHEIFFSNILLITNVWW